MSKAMGADYLNPSLSAEQRADDLLRRMSLEEKMGQIVGYMPEKGSFELLEKNYPHGVGEVAMLFAGELDNKEALINKVIQIQTQIMKLSEHQIPAIFHMETLTGGMMPEAASLPSAIGQASTWNPALIRELGKIVGRQARIAGATHAFAPVLDVARDPRFGRQGETYGEDPTLVSAIGTAYIAGLQHDGNLKKGVLACAKHFLGYHATQGGIHAASTAVPPRILREVYAKPFQAAITDTNMRSIMNSYGSIDGQIAAGSYEILTTLLREEMGFDGVVVSDYSSISEQHTRHRLFESKTDTGEHSLQAGMDVELPAKDCYNDELMLRFRNGSADIGALDRAVRNVLIAKFELGLFEQPFPEPEYTGEGSFGGEKMHKLLVHTARQSLVLLKNNGVLPLKRKQQKIAVIGHHAQSIRALFGGYSFASLVEAMSGVGNTMAGVDFEKISNLNKEEFTMDRGHYTYPGSKIQIENPAVDQRLQQLYPEIRTLLQQIQAENPQAEITYAYGYAYAGSDTSMHQEALKAAEEADIVILTLGGKFGWGTACTTGEGIDATHIQIPDCQETFIRKLAGLNKPTVAVHFDGRPISSDMADLHIDAILEVWSPGQYGAEAVADVLFGDYNPAGRLPVTIAYNAGQAPLFYNHDNGASYHVGTDTAFTSYVDCPREPRYYFGHGLSYTTFDYSTFEIERAEVKPDGNVAVTVEVTNTGDRIGEEVVQLYIRDLYASMVRPNLDLVGFIRVALAPGETKKISFTMHPSQFAFLDKDMKWKIEAGEMELLIGASCQDIRQTGRFRIISDLFIDGKSRSFNAKAEVL
ncbi:glycoside hydrolase family 3 N-terminal domain-containing protein [Saccharibacillus sp. CPCC 101409]|uniref:glycoside hydrolase family 3 N-terminal domain-containing protein n=1 Tax=Saccharibacillus sp. CPCC 101409 TaxID=3058041 RepID=UPI0026722993|nr:glycoside hydrolase family 3 N-terminal domain-containing protein [Saccharibacillus sp. CPCC 101409]MDO3411919.1 glycoside hydrolase family 3 N-terminal domain-containing protein [Saccharibacillus sp. CPCC 101409]